MPWGSHYSPLATGTSTRVIAFCRSFGMAHHRVRMGLPRPNARKRSQTRSRSMRFELS